MLLRPRRLRLCLASTKVSKKIAAGSVVAAMPIPPLARVQVRQCRALDDQNVGQNGELATLRSIAWARSCFRRRIDTTPYNWGRMLKSSFPIRLTSNFTSYGKD